MKKVLFMLVLLVGAPFSVLANSYVGIGYTAMEYEETGGSNKLTSDPGVVYLQAGTKFSNLFGIEARFGTGAQSDDIRINGSRTTADGEVVSYLGVFATLSADSEVARLYGLAGMTRTKVKASAAGFGSSEDNITSPALGAGISFHLGETIDVSVDYVKYIRQGDVDFDGNDIDMDGVSVSLIARF